MNSNGKFDYLVVGGGPAGLTASLLLALNGRRVCLIDKSPQLGGSLARFHINGTPFDTGVHFVGGLTQEGVLDQILRVLGLRDTVEAVPIKENLFKYIFESDQAEYALPTGFERLRDYLETEFPQEKDAVHGFMERLRAVRRATPAMDLRRLTESAGTIDDDYITLTEVLNQFTQNRRLRCLFSALCPCYGTAPSEVSFATHSRIAHDFFLDTNTLVGGGAPLVEGFESALRELGVEIRCNTHVTQCVAGSGDTVETFVLNTGETLSADEAIFTIHPSQLVETLPVDKLSPAFRRRVASMEPSIGFFSVFAKASTVPAEGFQKEIISLLPGEDFDELLRSQPLADGPLILISGREPTGRGDVHTLTALELSFPEHVEQWRDTALKRRPPDYLDYKRERTEAILGRVGNHPSAYSSSSLEVLDSASMLTYRDYLHSPCGSAYGIRQKIGQINVFGRLPLRNVYAAGQCSLLPGLAGAMMSSFLLMRSILGRDALANFISQRLCP